MYVLLGDRVRDKFALINAMSVDPLYLQHKHAQQAVDYRVKWLEMVAIEYYSCFLRTYFSIGVLHWVADSAHLNFGLQSEAMALKVYDITFEKYEISTFFFRTLIHLFSVFI